jgi:hypothetical protein
VTAGRRAPGYESGYGDGDEPDYAPVSPAPPPGWTAPHAAPFPAPLAAPLPPARSSRTAIRRQSARLALLMFLLGLAGAAAAVAISRPKGYAWVALPLVTVSGVVTVVASVRLIVLLQRQGTTGGMSRSARASNGFAAVILTTAVLIGLGGAWTLVWGDFQNRVDGCVTGDWTVDSHLMGTFPHLTGKGAQLNLTADGDGALRADNIPYTATADGHTFRAIETFTMNFLFAAHGGHIWVDGFYRTETEKATIDGKAWEPLNGPDFAGILNSYGGYLDFTCSGSRLTISALGTVHITAHRAT